MKCFNCCKCRETDVIVGGRPPSSKQADSKSLQLVNVDDDENKIETEESSLYYLSAESEEDEISVEVEGIGSFFFDTVESSGALANDMSSNGTHNVPSDQTGQHHRGLAEDEALLAPSSSCTSRISRSSEEWGFPGSLTPHQLAAYQEFRSEVKRRGGVYEEMVYCYKEIEPEPYALCRFLRWANFHPEKVFSYMDAHVDRWLEAKKHNFYPDASVGAAPLSVLLTQFPSVYTGFAKEGFPVCYIQSSNLSVEGIDCVTDVEKLPHFIWYTMLHDIKRIYVEAKSRHPSMNRLEQITVLNLDGLSPRFMTPRTYAVSQQADVVAQAFPEMMYRLIIINAPRFFNFFWNSFKVLLDPNTTKRIELYSSPEKGLERLMELIDDSELPSDYGGHGMSTSEAILREGRTGPVPQRQIVQLLKIRRENQFEFTVEADEEVSLEIYTRSKSRTEFTLVDQEGQAIRQITVEPAGEGPYRTKLAECVRGPAAFTVVGRHADGFGSTEYFLVVGEVFLSVSAQQNGHTSTT